MHQRKNIKGQQVSITAYLTTDLVVTTSAEGRDTDTSGVPNVVRVVRERACRQCLGQDALSILFSHAFEAPAHRVMLPSRHSPGLKCNCGTKMSGDKAGIFSGNAAEQNKCI